jgi:hypothetical protein
MLQRRIATAALFFFLGTGQAFAGAFQVKTQQGTLSRKENERPISLPRALLKLDVSFEVLEGVSGFNDTGDNGCDPLTEQGCGDTSSFLLVRSNQGAPLGRNQVTQFITHFNIGYGLTENWTFNFDIPVVRATETYVANGANEQQQIDLQLLSGALPQRETTALGDMRFNLQYQFLRTYEGPMRALVGRVTMRVPTGNESPGFGAKQDPETGELVDVRTLLTGTGTNDGDFGISYKQQIGGALAVTADGGYVVRFPANVAYIFDRFDETVNLGDDGFNTSAKLDLGDQAYLRARLTVSPSEKWYGTLEVRGTRWGATRVAKSRLVEQDIQVDEQTVDPGRLVFVGPSYKDIPESAGYLVSTTPRFVYQPKDWLEVGASFDLHLTGKNTNYVRPSDDPADPFGQVGEEENNFFPLQVLGTPAGPFILGTARLGLTFKY